jgi:hypothetical protein
MRSPQERPALFTADGLAVLHGAHPVFQVALHAQLADHQAGDDGDQQAQPRYSAATFQPNMPNSRASATSLTIGAEIRKEKVTPSGTPA